VRIGDRSEDSNSLREESFIPRDWVVMTGESARVRLWMWIWTITLTTIVEVLNFEDEIL
jgi:hypothetical protein